MTGADGAEAHLRIGVLALQGDFAEHAKVLAGLGATPVMVRKPADLEGLSGIALPGGESTTMRLLLERYGLTQPLSALIKDGLPTLATCAGLILLASDIEGEGEGPLASLDITVVRNAFGRQLESFEAEISGPPGGPPYHAIFIRAPSITRVGDDVEVLARLPDDDSPVAVRQGVITGLAFHPELGGETRFHAALMMSAQVWAGLADTRSRSG